MEQPSAPDAILCANGRCDVVLHDGFTLCADHQADLVRDLDAVADVWANLQVTIRRQDATSAAIGGAGVAAVSVPCINLDAHDKGETLSSILNGWAGALALNYRQRTPPAAARFLKDHMRVVVKEDWAGDLKQELSRSLHECRATTDRALDFISLGVCGFGDCDGDVRAISGADTARCRRCGTVWDVRERQQWDIGVAYHVPGSLRLIVQALRGLNQISISYDTARQWAHRGKLYGHCDLATRQARYTPADILASVQHPPRRRRHTTT